MPNQVGVGLAGAGVRRAARFASVPFRAAQRRYLPVGRQLYLFPDAVTTELPGEARLARSQVSAWLRAHDAPRAVLGILAQEFAIRCASRPRCISCTSPINLPLSHTEGINKPVLPGSSPSYAPVTGLAAGAGRSLLPSQAGLTPHSVTVLLTLLSWCVVLAFGLLGTGVLHCARVEESHWPFSCPQLWSA